MFRFGVTLALMDKDGRETRHRVEVKERENVFHFPCDAAPKAVRFDPEFDVLKTFKHKRGREALEPILKHAPEAIGRAEAARELGKEGSPQAVAALEHALPERFLLGRARRLRPRARRRTDLGGAHGAHSRASRPSIPRRGAPRSTRWENSATTATRRTRSRGVLERGDPSYFVEAEAALALGRTRDDRAFDQLERALASASPIST